MMFRGRVAAVSYLNTVPFIYGMEHAEDLRAALLLSPPSGCARAFSAGEADIALVPTGALPTLKNYEIVTPFCIGASGAVRTVTLMSDEPVERIGRVWLDPHSMTSARLVQVLCERHWRVDAGFMPLDDYARVDAPEPGDGFMLIGDKVFDYEGRLAHTWDLAVEWQAMTGLPFVFAVWVAREGVEPGTVAALEAALDYGVHHIREAVAHGGHSGKPYALDYLTRNIDYRFDEPKGRALSLFKQMMP